MITPGSTPKHTFTLLEEVENIQNIFASYGQHGVELFCKKGNDVQWDGNDILVQLSQQDTLKLECGVVAQMQLKLLLTDGNVRYTEVVTDDVAPVILNREVIS